MSGSAQSPLAALRDELAGGAWASWLDQPVAALGLPREAMSGVSRALRQGTLAELLGATVPTWLERRLDAAIRAAVAAEATRAAVVAPRAGSADWGTTLDAAGLGWLGHRVVGADHPAGDADDAVPVAAFLGQSIPATHGRRRERQADVERWVLGLIARRCPPVTLAGRTPLAARLAQRVAEWRTAAPPPVIGRVSAQVAAQEVRVEVGVRSCDGGREPSVFRLDAGALVGAAAGCRHPGGCPHRLAVYATLIAWLDGPDAPALLAFGDEPGWRRALAQLGPAPDDAFPELAIAEGRLAVALCVGGTRVTGGWHPQASALGRALLAAQEPSAQLAALSAFPAVRFAGRSVRVVLATATVAIGGDGAGATVTVRVDDTDLSPADFAARPRFGVFVWAVERPDRLVFAAAPPALSALGALADAPVPAAAVGPLVAALAGHGAAVALSPGWEQRRAVPVRPAAELTFEPQRGLFVRFRVADEDGVLRVAGDGPAAVRRWRGAQFETLTRDLAGERRAVDAIAAALGRDGVDLLPEEPDALRCAALPDAVRVVRALEALADVALVWRKSLRIHRVGRDAVRVALRPLGAWFDVTGEVDLGAGEVVPLAELLDAVRARQRWFAVAPGVVIELAADLFARWAPLADAVDADRDGLRVGQVHGAALADALGERARLAPVEPDEVPQPPGLAVALRPYQQAGFAWMARRTAWAPGVVLADEMGLGKTAQAVALLCHRPGPALVVAPTSVAANWLAELARFAPSLRVVDHRGPDRASALHPAPGEVVVTTWELLVRDAGALGAVSWDVAVFDEAQQIKNARTRRALAAAGLTARAKVALTGTPVENRLSELWSLLSIVVPGLLPREEVFVARYQVPIERDRDPQVLDRLRALIAPFVLRRRKREVLGELPPKTDVVERVELTPAQRGVYEQIRVAAVAALGADPGPQARFRVLAAITRLRQAACDLRLIDGGEGGAKIPRLVELLAEATAGGGQALVFSEFTRLLDLAADAVAAAGLGALRIDGTTPPAERSRRVAAFQAGEAPVFLLSRKAAGTGLNLTQATTVIHLDPWWNPAVEDQATDRAHRIGQSQPVTVIRLVAADTIEERVLALHGEKRALVAGVFDGGSATDPIAPADWWSLLVDGDGAPPAVSPAAPALPLADRVRLAAARLPHLGVPAPVAAGYAAEAADLAAWLDDHPACSSWSDAREGWLAVRDTAARRAALGVLTGLLPWTR